MIAKNTSSLVYFTKASSLISLFFDIAEETPAGVAFHFSL